MKKFLIFPVLAFVGILFMAFVGVKYPVAHHHTYEEGEYLRYRVTYGVMDAGEAILQTQFSTKRPQGREVIHVIGTGRTLGAFNAFYKVDDRYESFIDKKGAFPWEFIRNVNEGGYIIKQDYKFDQNLQQVRTEKGKVNVPMGIQDMISAFYYARTINFRSLKPCQIVEFKCFMDGEIYPLKIKYVGKENIKIRKGTFKCIKFVPVVQKGRVFKSEDDVSFYVTDDDNKIPIFVKAHIKVGTVKLQLVEWKGILNPISKIK